MKQCSEKAYSLDEERYDYDTPEEAYQQAIDNGRIEEGEILTLWEGDKVVQHHSDFFSVQSLIEDMACQADDIGGEFAESYIQRLEELDTTKLHTLIEVWFIENVPKPDFFMIENAKEITYSAS